MVHDIEDNHTGIEALHAISSKFVPRPTPGSVLNDLLLGLKRFRSSLRWWEFWKRYKDRDVNTSDSCQENQRDSELFKYFNECENDQGLGVVSLKSSTSARAPPKGSEDLEQFLRHMERAVIEEYGKCKPAYQDRSFEREIPSSANNFKLSRYLSALAKDEDLLVVPSDKSNRWISIDKTKYSSLLKKKLLETCTIVDRSVLTDTHVHLTNFINLRSDHLSTKELSYIIGKLDQKRLASPKLLIKDHKPPNAENTFPVRLIIPCNNFAAGLCEIGYRAIEQVFITNSIKISNFTLQNSYDLIDSVKERDFNFENSCLYGIDVVNMYPSISCKLVKRAIDYFSVAVPRAGKAIIRRAWEILQEGMKFNFVTFEGIFYRYRGNGTTENPALSIGNFESAFLADLVMSYIFNSANEQGLFKDFAISKIYRDDGFFIPNRKNINIDSWLHNFQRYVNGLTKNTGSDIVFTLRKPEIDGSIDFLDLFLYYSESGDLAYKVFKKESQTIKYLNSDSVHRPVVKNSVRNGVFERLCRLTSPSEATKHKKFSEIYPEHYEALKVAGAKNIDISLNDFRIENEQNKAKNRKKSRKRKTDVYFTIGFSSFFRYPIHKIINRLKKLHNQTWRFSMSYRRFANISQILSSDVDRKLNLGLVTDFSRENCNCSRVSKVNGECIYGGDCRSKIVVYECTCLICSKVYRGNTQQNVKTRINKHLDEVRSEIGGKEKYDSFSGHFASHFSKKDKPSREALREIISVSILWRGDHIKTPKNFKSNQCNLCAAERSLLVEGMLNPEIELVNKNHELYRNCMHRPRFPRFLNDIH